MVGVGKQVLAAVVRLLKNVLLMRSFPSDLVLRALIELALLIFVQEKGKAL